jgi:hypothetical protein
MTHIAETFNEYGTPVSMFRCSGCSTTFTVCPSVPEERRDQWSGCMGVDCTTYDEARDGDKLFDAGKVQRVGDRSHICLVPTTHAKAGAVGTDERSEGVNQ